MSEKLNPPESREQSTDHVEVAHEQLEKNRQEVHERAAQHEKAHNKTEQLETARQTAEKEAKAKEELAMPTNENKAEPVYFTRADRERSFDTTMNHVRSQLGRPQRIFSNIIHQKQIEKASEVVGKTVARPSGILGASAAALLGVGFLLLVAKRTGFQLAGSEFWILLCAGYLAGLTLEGLRKLFSKSKELTR